MADVLPPKANVIIQKLNIDKNHFLDIIPIELVI